MYWAIFAEFRNGMMEEASIVSIFIISNAFKDVCKNGHKNSPSAIERNGVHICISNYSVIISANMRDTCQISEIRHTIFSQL